MTRRGSTSGAGPRISDDRMARVALAALAEPGDTELDELVVRHEPVGALEVLLTGAGTVSRAAARRLGARSPRQFVDDVLRGTDRIGARVVTAADAEWPAALAVLPADVAEQHLPNGAPRCAPLALWLRGAGAAASLLTGSVAVVGARACTPYGAHQATEIGYKLAAAGRVLLGGGGFGIDASAHRAALAAGGTTAAVLAFGLDISYPSAHGVLFDDIARDGLLISEHPPGTLPSRLRLAGRARLLAAFSSAVVVVEAGSRSGAKSVARLAAALGRPVFAIPGSVESAQSTGTHELVREGIARLVTGADQILADLARVEASADDSQAAPAEAERAVEGATECERRPGLTDTDREGGSR